MSWLWVAILGVAGVLVRYGLVLFMPAVGVGSISYAVLTVNIVGSALGGFLMGSPMIAARVPEPWMVAMIIGFLGGMTTFSAVSMDTVRLWQGGFIQIAILNLLLNNFLAILGCFLGYKIGIRFA